MAAPEKVEVRGQCVPIKLHEGLELQHLADSASEVQLAEFCAASNTCSIQKLIFLCLHFSTFKSEISKQSISEDEIFLH